MEWCAKLLRECTSAADAMHAHAIIQRSGAFAGSSSRDRLCMSNMIINTYGRCRLPWQAKRVFDSLHPKNSFSWTFMLRAFLDNGRTADAAAVFAAMPQPNVATCTTVLTVHASEGDVDRAVAAFDRMDIPDVAAWNALLSCYSSNGRTAAAIACFHQQMPSRDVISWTALTVAYVQAGDLRNAEQTFGAMPQRNEYAWNAMLSAFAGSGHPRRAKGIFDEMPHRTAVSFNALISSYASTGKNLVGARAVLEKMPQWATVSLNAMVTAYAQTGYPLDSKLLFDQMPQKNVISWNAMLAACSGDGLIDSAASIFESMPERDVISWNAMLAATAQAGRSDAAAALLGSMLLEGIRPGEATFTSLLVACSHGGSLPGAISHFHAISIDFGAALSKDHYSCIVDALARTGHLDETQQLTETLPCLSASDVPWRSLLAACRAAKDVPRAEYAAARISRLMEDAPHGMFRATSRTFRLRGS